MTPVEEGIVSLCFFVGACIYGQTFKLGWSRTINPDRVFGAYTIVRASAEGITFAEVPA